MSPRIPPAALEIASTCTGVRARLLSRLVSGIYDEALRPHRLKISQLNLLTAVAVLPGSTAGELRARLAIDASTLSRNLRRMQDRGWITRSASSDAREHPLSVTPEGRRLLRALLPAWRRTEAKVRDLLGTDVVAAIGAATNPVLFPPEPA